MIIYKATNKKNGKIYIGQTSRTLKERMSEHIRHNLTAFDKALQKYGIESFTVEQIDTANSIDELNEKEKYWIAKYNSVLPNGYNMCAGGDNTLGYHHREESKQKMSTVKKGMFVGSNNPFYGKRHSEEAKHKMSAGRKGMAHLTNDQVQRLRQSHHTVKVRNIETDEIFDTIKEAAKKYNLKDTHITRVCKGKRKTTGGFHWCYVESQI